MLLHVERNPALSDDADASISKKRSGATETP